MRHRARLLMLACSMSALAASACAPRAASSADLDALVQQGLQTAHADLTAQPTTPSGGLQSGSTNRSAFGDFGISITFTYPEDFSEGALAEVLPRMAIQDPVDPEYPEHARIIFTAYSGDYYSNTSPGIRVFRAAEVDAMDPAVIASLKEVLSGTSQNRFDFPRLPFAGRTVDAQARTVSFQRGEGYRFLAQGSFDAAELRSTHLYYLYQGLTSDDKYLVTVLLGVDAPFVSDLATGGPFTSSQAADDYLTTLNGRIDAAGAADFSPNLDALDRLVQSIDVVEE